MLQGVRVKHFAVFLMAGVVFSATLNFDSLCNIRVVNSCRSVTQMYRFGIALPPSPNSYIEGEFHLFSKTKSSCKGGWSNSAAHKVGLPLWLHLHILQESSTTNEFISYFREPGRSTLPFPPCQPQVWPKRGIQIELIKPGYSRVLRAWLNFSPGLTFTTPHTAATTAAAVRFACQRCGPLLPSSVYLSLFCTRMDGWMERRGVWE